VVRLKLKELNGQTIITPLRTQKFELCTYVVDFLEGLLPIRAMGGELACTILDLDTHTRL
jgi:hypothetical protein